MNRVFPLCFSALFLLLAACPASVEGEVNGQRVPPLQTAIFLPDSDGAPREVMLASFPDGCNRLEAFKQESSGASTEERQRLEAKHLGEDYWYVQLWLLTDPDAEPEGQVIDLSYPAVKERGVGELHLVHREVFAENDGEAYGRTTTYWGTAGSLDIERYVDMLAFDARGSVAFGGPPYEVEPADEVDIAFRASVCGSF